MSNTKSALFGIIANEEQQFCVWPTRRKLLPGWHYTGPTGTKAAMQAFVGQQFVETVPAAYITPERRFRDSQSTS
jgi:uncharacterized protein YbdZ (MbtH family)